MAINHHSFQHHDLMLCCCNALCPPLWLRPWVCLARLRS
jgi:hypothetical protein